MFVVNALACTVFFLLLMKLVLLFSRSRKSFECEELSLGSSDSMAKRSRIEELVKNIEKYEKLKNIYSKVVLVNNVINYPIGLFLASSFAEKNVNSNIVGLVGVAVLVSSIIDLFVNSKDKLVKCSIAVSQLNDMRRSSENKINQCKNLEEQRCVADQCAEEIRQKLSVVEGWLCG
jgi:hypothetical protein